MVDVTVDGIVLLEGLAGGTRLCVGEVDRLGSHEIPVAAEIRVRLDARLGDAMQRRLEREARALDGRCNALDRAGTRFANAAATRLQRSVAALAAGDPLAPLARGYAIVSSGGRVVRAAASLRPGDSITARLERGTLTARVEAVDDDG